MRISIVILTIILATSIASAQHLGNTMPVKSDSHVMSNPAADGREGGETINDAYPLTGLPIYDSGATCDNIDGYDEICPYSGSTSPDVVYSWISIINGRLYVDLCGSLYDTKLYMYDSDQNLVDCNDDFYFDEGCGTYVSALECAPVVIGEIYYIVIDGYGGDCGEYIMSIEELVLPPPCEVECPDGAQLENEPPLVDGYVDTWNGGCTNDPYVAQWIDCSNFCGEGGWYVADGGAYYRDTDWLECAAAGTTITWTADANSQTSCYQVDVNDCNDPSIIQGMSVGECYPGTMIIDTTPGEIVTLWLGSVHVVQPTSCYSTSHMYDYVFSIEGIVESSATQNATWSGVKGLYR